MVSGRKLRSGLLGSKKARAMKFDRDKMERRDGGGGCNTTTTTRPAAGAALIGVRH